MTIHASGDQQCLVIATVWSFFWIYSFEEATIKAAAKWQTRLEILIEEEFDVVILSQ